MNLRVGHGYDIHAFGEDGDHVVIAGVRLPCDRSLRAHSDGDVALHALCDALLGAAALGDIGMHFPDDDPAWRGADSLRLLARVVDRVAAAGWRPLNADITVVAERPRIREHVEAMRDQVAPSLGLERDAVSIKATTHEGIGGLGRAEGIAAHAVVLLLGSR